MKQNSILEEKLCFSLYSVTNALIHQYRPLLKEFDLTYPQFVVLMALYEQDDIPLRALGQKTLFDSGTLTPLVQKLEGKGFLKRMAVVGDERMKNVVLTKKAHEMKEALLELPGKMRCTMQMKDEELDLLRQLSANLLKDL